MIPQINNPYWRVTPTGKGSDYDYYGATKGAGAGADYRWWDNFDNLDPSFFAGTGSKTKGTDNLKNAFKGWKEKASNLGNGFANYIDPNAYGWSKSSGLKFTNPSTGKVTNLGKWGNIAGGIMQGIDAAQGLSDYQKTLNANDDLMSKIQVSALGNPLLSSYLTQDQLNLLGDIQSGRYDDNASAEDFLSGAVGGLGNAAMGALMGIPGGVPGMIIGGVGSLINSGIDNLSASSGQNTTELQALYQALQDADAQYRSMKRPNFTGLGIQQQYQNMYA